jgi:hypothetical protein
MIRRTAARWLTVAAVAAVPLGLLGAHNPAQAAPGGCTPFTNAGSNVQLKSCLFKNPPLTSYPSAVNFVDRQIPLGCTIVIRVHEVNTDNFKANTQSCILRSTFGNVVVLNPVQMQCVSGHRYITELSVTWRHATGGREHSALVKSPQLTC